MIEHTPPHHDRNGDESKDAQREQPLFARIDFVLGLVGNSHRSCPISSIGNSYRSNAQPFGRTRTKRNNRHCNFKREPPRSAQSFRPNPTTGVPLSQHTIYFKTYDLTAAKTRKRALRREHDMRSEMIRLPDLAHLVWLGEPI